ncbi:MAG: ATP-binding cassette domain-containing protein, partial [Cyclobacteriaceae bacterium]|nr:ATP-binding cassette domain-containing protein [Cyclobacteriaceae bacterium]
MSEPVLKAIIQLFALVAKEDLVTKQERDHIKSFLSDHLSDTAVEGKLKLFDQHIENLSEKMSPQEEQKTIASICESINKEIAQKQKTVIMVELLSVILSDGEISSHEDYLAKSIGAALNIETGNIELIEKFLLAKTAEEFDHEDILIINSENKTYGRCKHIQRAELNGFVSILHIRSTDVYFFEYMGTTDVFLNGVPQRSRRINVLATGSTIRWNNVQPVYYGDILAQFKQLGNGKRVSFEGKNISYQFKNGKLGLRKVNIYEESGKLVALMGASGAGKSTLLHVLNGTERPSEGKVLINGIDIHMEPKKVEGIIGFVPQDDLLIEDLTVYQNLYFAAKLCFSHLNEKQIDALVMRTLDDLGLMETKDLTVGSPLRKTISGGQRKRLNIGLELLREPTVLFCDEPTSGLSSRDSENIIDL